MLLEWPGSHPCGLTGHGARCSVEPPRATGNEGRAHLSCSASSPGPSNLCSLTAGLPARTSLTLPNGGYHTT